MTKCRSLLDLVPRASPKNIARYFSVTTDGKQSSPIHYALTTLLPDKEEDFLTFKTILTDYKVLQTSLWMDKLFGIENIGISCSNLRTKFKLLDQGDSDINLPEELLRKREKGLSVDQIAVDRFFDDKENELPLRDIYYNITKFAKETDLGYYKFENDDGELIGGGSLAPMSDDLPITKAEMSVHIISKDKGLGSFSVGRLLQKGFKDFGLKEIWALSAIDHPVTPVMCAKHGMIILSDKKIGMKLYYMDKNMWNASKDKVDKAKRVSPIFF